MDEDVEDAKRNLREESLFTQVLRKFNDFRFRKFAVHELNLESGLEVRLFQSPKSKSVVYIELVHGESFKPMGRTDSRSFHAIAPRNSAWRKLQDIQSDFRSAELPSDYYFDDASAHLFFSLDGQVFSIPVSDLVVIQSKIREFEGAATQ